jgi:hypothetical protein
VERVFGRSVEIPHNVAAALARLSHERAGARGYARRADDYGRGAYNDPALPIYQGLIGEWAFAHLMRARGAEVEWKPQTFESADFEDVVVSGVSVGVKTARALPAWVDVQAHARSRSQCEIVCAALCGDAMTFDVRGVRVVGFITRDDLIRLDVTNSPRLNRPSYCVTKGSLRTDEAEFFSTVF